jgi:Tol biopolymer transport system component
VAQKEGHRQIWIRSLDQPEGHPVQGAEGGHRPFWSPDGRSIGFFVDGSLRRVSVSGGAPLTIAPAANGRGAVWLPDGNIVFAPTPGSQLLVVPAGGGQPRALREDDKNYQREPRALPVQDHFLFLEDTGGGEWTMYVGSLDGSAPTKIGLTGGGAEYANGRLLYLQGRTLVAQPFDLNSFQLYGEPTPLAEDIIRDNNYGIGVFSASEEGVLCYQAGSGTGAQLVWLDRDGVQVGVQGQRADYAELTLSPDAKTIAAIIDDLDGKSDIWLIDVARDTRQRFTFTPDDIAMRRSEAKWAPDGSFLVYSIESDSSTALYTKRTDGSGGEELLLKVPGKRLWPYDVSPDGKLVLFGQEEQDSKEDLWVVPMDGEGEALAVLTTPFDEWPGSFSPDGRWLAIDSDETGRREVYVIPFPGGGGRWQVSRDGGRFPRWNAAGTELYYIDLEGGMMAATVDPTGGVFRSQDPVKLFQADLASGSYGGCDVDPSGERFLILQPAAQFAPISLYVNWEEALEVR